MHLSHHSTANPTPESLHAFLTECRQLSRADNHPKLVSISIDIAPLDPLAVLETIYEPNQEHLYIETPHTADALAAAEPILSHTASGPDRFASIRRFIDETLQHTLTVGTSTARSGPHFLTTFAFNDTTPTDSPFPAARSFVPAWQVALHGNITTAVANLLIRPDSDLAPLAQRIWRAHQKFTRFDYSSLPNTGSSTEPTILSTTPVGDYRQTVTRGLQQIQSAQLEKIVLARALDIQSSAPLHPLRILNNLRERHPHSYIFSTSNARAQTFLGASPERLAKVTGRTLQTDALAGTSPRGDTPARDAILANSLLRDEKNLREQRHVIEAIRQQLAPLALTLQIPANPVLNRLSNIQHLHTPITATLPPYIHILDILALLHPTPAVGGSPRDAALQLIPQLEPFDRGLYAGAIGWINSHGDGDFTVAIRSALLDGTSTRLYAGAGIIAGSSPDAEFEETSLKLKTIQNALRSV